MFENIAPGDYVVGVEAPDDASMTSGNTPTDPDDNMDGVNDGTQASDGAESFSQTITLVPGEEPDDDMETAQGGGQDSDNETNGNMTVDFGFVPDMSIGSTVYYDTDMDGMHDMGEDGIEGVTVELLADTDGDGMIDDVIATDVTDANGAVSYTHLTLPTKA